MIIKRERSPSALASAVSEIPSASSRTRCQWRVASAELRPAIHSAARRCHCAAGGFDCARRGCVKRVPALTEQRVVRDRLRERMLEAVFRDRIQRLLMEKLAAAQPSERLGELTVRKLDDC